jgi:glycosyltransferase involved in cell wall biosynthesis
MTPLISFAITTHNEGEYIRDLLDQLVPYCEQTGDEIVVVDDNSTDVFTQNLLYDYADKDKIQLYQHELNNDFASHKNFLNSKCRGEYIFQVDADEKFHNNLLTYLHDIVDNNKNIDLFLIPRVNIVNGLTEQDIRGWGWRINEKGWVMFPDYQTRLYRNVEEIKWEGNVHERIVGYKTTAPLPEEEEWCLYHIKEIERQRKQNDYYATITR